MTSFAKLSEKIIEFQPFWNFLFFREIIIDYDNAASIFAAEGLFRSDMVWP